MNKLNVCCACLEFCEMNTSIDGSIKHLYAVLTNLQMPDELQLCRYCWWLLKKSYEFVEKCRIARVVLERCSQDDCSWEVDVDLLKHQDVYHQNERLFKAKLTISETVNTEFPELTDVARTETVTFVEVEDILEAKTQKDDYDNEVDKMQNDIAETNCTEFILLNEEQANNDVSFEENNFNYKFENGNINECGPDILDSDLDFDEENEKEIGTTSKLDSIKTKSKSTKTKQMPMMKSKKKENETNFEFEALCLTIETQYEDLKSRRKESKYLNSKFRCYYCALGFDHEDSYKMHMSRHEESNGKYRCEICTLRFATRSGFCMHRAVHRQRFRCCLCLEVVKNRQFHRARCRVKMAADVTVNCNVCGKEFGDSASMERHVKRQHTKSDRQTFRCRQCDKTFSYLHTLRSHLLLHEETSCHSCRLCDRSFVTRKQLADHEKSHAEIKGNYYCASCDVTLKTAKSLQAHYARSSKHALPERYRYNCASCNATYTNASDLRAHTERNHSTEAIYRCTACNVTYRCAKSLNNHCLRVHRKRNGSQSFVCEFCGKSFKAKSVLQKHVELHLSERMEVSKLELTESDAQKDDSFRTMYSNMSVKELNVI